MAIQLRRMNSDIVRISYLRLLPVQIFGIVVSAINTSADSVFTGRFIGPDAMAAVGLFAPIATFFGMVNVLIVGIQMLCGNYIGAGEGKKVVSLFSAGVVFLALYGAALAAAGLAFRVPLSYMLRAKDAVTAGMLQDYIAAYAIGIPGQFLVGIMSVLLPYNSEMKRAYLSIALMIVTNVTMDAIFTIPLHMGTFGLGLATSGSYIITALYLLHGYLDQNKAVHFRWNDYDFRTFPKAVMLGLPNLMFTIGCTAKSYIMNSTLMENVGNAAMAAMTVQGNICWILGSVPMGCSLALLALGSVYYGESDRGSLIRLWRMAMVTGTILSAAVMGMLIGFAPFFATVFLAGGSQAWHITVRMLRLFPGFLVFNAWFNILLKTYQVQNQMTLVNVLSVAENLIMGVLTVSFAGVIGADAVWLSFPASDLICLFIIAVSVFVKAGKITFRVSDWMKIPADFGAREDELLEFSVSSMEEVIGVSEAVMNFCKERGVPHRNCYIAGLCVEEMAGNVISHGFAKDHRKHAVDIRIVVKDDLTIRIRDDCAGFDPKKRIEQFDPENVAENMGIRLIGKIASVMEYQNNAGVNNVLIKV